MTLRPAVTVTLALALLAGPATGAASPGLPAGCAPEAVQSAYNQGYIKGVEDIKAQLAAATQRMQAQVQGQLNDQLAQLQKQQDAQLAQNMRAAQDRALQDAVSAPMPAALTGGSQPAATAPPAAPPASPPAPKPAALPADPKPADLPADPADLAPGSTLTITNAERLPPELYSGLLAYLAR